MCDNIILCRSKVHTSLNTATTCTYSMYFGRHSAHSAIHCSIHILHTAPAHSPFHCISTRPLSLYQHTAPFTVPAHSPFHCTSTQPLSLYQHTAPFTVPAHGPFHCTSTRPLSLHQHTAPFTAPAHSPFHCTSTQPLSLHQHTAPFTAPKQLVPLRSVLKLFCLLPSLSNNLTREAG